MTAIIRVAPDLTLRAELPADRAFIRALFREQRQDGFALTGLPPDAIATLLDSQADAQSSQYARMFPDADRFIVERRSQPVGRLYVQRGAERWHLIDIALAAAVRGQGMGTVLVEWLVSQAHLAGAAAMELRVAHDNGRAEALYQRLGFHAVEGDSATHRHLRRLLS